MSGNLSASPLCECGHTKERHHRHIVQCADCTCHSFRAKPGEGSLLAGHKGLRWNRWKAWRIRRDPTDDRPYFEASFLFQAKDMDEAGRLFDAMSDGLGCGEGICDADHPCPHFRVGGLHMLDEGES